MLDEVEILSPGGVPVFYHSNTDTGEDDDRFLLQASFITALTQFAQELRNGDVELISMEKKRYLVNKTNEFTVIFTSAEFATNEMYNYKEQIEKVSSFLQSKLADYNMENTRLEALDKPIEELNNYLIEQELIIKADEYSVSSFRKGVNQLVFRSVGYEPGVCNIGETERMRRLTYGLISFVISFALFGLIYVFALPQWTILLLFIPNFSGFLGFFQYFYRFCVTNALTEKYEMN